MNKTVKQEKWFKNQKQFFKLKKTLKQFQTLKSQKKNSQNEKEGYLHRCENIKQFEE